MGRMVCFEFGQGLKMAFGQSLVLGLGPSHESGQQVHACKTRDYSTAAVGGSVVCMHRAAHLHCRHAQEINI